MPLFPSLLILKYIPHHNEKRYILPSLEKPLVLALDDLEQIFVKEEVFFFEDDTKLA